MDEPWQVYRDEFFDRARDIPDQEVNVEGDMAEAARETHESAVDRLVNQLDYREPEALALTHAFGEAVKVWMSEGHFDWDDLIERLQAAQMDWEQSVGHPG